MTDGRLGLLAWFLVNVGLVACSDSGAGAPASTDDAGGRTDANTPLPDGATTRGEPGVMLNMFGTPRSCDVACKTYGFRCTDTCVDGNGATTVGSASYQTQSSRVPVVSCEEDVPKTRDGNELAQTECCCTAPQTTSVKGPDPARSCQDVCASQGLRCDPTAWKSYPRDQAVGEASYRCSGTRLAPLERCDRAPARTLPENANCVLTSYFCSCLP
jgi:hypothetical protein